MASRHPRPSCAVPDIAPWRSNRRARAPASSSRCSYPPRAAHWYMTIRGCAACLGRKRVQGKQRHQRFQEPVLVVFDRPEIRAARRDHLMTQGTLGKLGVTGDRDAVEARSANSASARRSSCSFSVPLFGPAPAHPEARRRPPDARPESVRRGSRGGACRPAPPPPWNRPPGRGPTRPAPVRRRRGRDRERPETPSPRSGWWPG